MQRRKEDEAKMVEQATRVACTAKSEAVSSHPSQARLNCNHASCSMLIYSSLVSPYFCIDSTSNEFTGDPLPHPHVHCCYLSYFGSEAPAYISCVLSKDHLPTCGGVQHHPHHPRRRRRDSRHRGQLHFEPPPYTFTFDPQHRLRWAFQCLRARSLTGIPMGAELR